MINVTMHRLYCQTKSWLNKAMSAGHASEKKKLFAHVASGKCLLVFFLLKSFLLKRLEYFLIWAEFPGIT